MAAITGTLFCDCEDVIRREERLLKPGRRLRERAVTARITTQHGEGDENFWRVRQAGAIHRISHFRCSLHQHVEFERHDVGRSSTEVVGRRSAAGYRDGNRFHVATVARLSSKSELSSVESEVRCTFGE